MTQRAQASLLSFSLLGGIRICDLSSTNEVSLVSCVLCCVSLFKLMQWYSCSFLRRELATAPAWVLSRGIEMAKTENRKNRFTPAAPRRKRMDQDLKGI